MKTKQNSKMSQRFVSEGRFFALPLVFEGVSFSIPPDESYITALTESPCGTKFFGTTRGDKCHIFAGSAKGGSAGILDVGVVEDAIDIPVILYLGSTVQEKRSSVIDTIIFIANTKDGAKIYRQTVYVPIDTIQEPYFSTTQLNDPCVLNQRRVTDALLTPNKKQLVCLTDNGVYEVDIYSGKSNNIYEFDFEKTVIQKWARLNDLFAYFLDENGSFIKLQLNTLAITPTGVTGSFDEQSWGFTVVDEKIIYAIGSGDFFAFIPKDNSIEKVGDAVLPAVKCMTVLPDNRVYGVCGSEIGFFFKLDISSRKSEALGAIVATIGIKRYGFEFSTMITGKDGEIYMSENDRGGHLWIYCPAIIKHK